MGSILLCLLASILLLSNVITAEEPDTNLIITRASREVELASSVVKQSVSFTFENKGGSPISSFIYVVDANVASHLAFISAEVKLYR